jgi:hypothetical protein
LNKKRAAEEEEGGRRKKKRMMRKMVKRTEIRSGRWILDGEWRAPGEAEGIDCS